ncbi:hypothetical protein GJ698_02385 [Pseudoduganella sp. FT26W]|uniref:Uncharacterized protein n=1 Tax=Duganella aquatilis TaxID=2666082 RepID=A0A844CSN4_9BURK|nr:hypothetical protein [Duganella aquatilis]MRW82938.1 hypothetical protein [Duganella aquatilis]
MSEKSSVAATIEGITAIGIAWIDLTNLLIKSNVIKKEEIQKLLQVNIETANANDQQTAQKMFAALSGALTNE